MDDVVHVEPPAARSGRRAALRVVLWVVLVASVLFACWGTPRPASQDDFARALKNGGVAGVQTSPGAYGLEQTGLRIQVTFTDDRTPVVVWEDTGGVLHRTMLTPILGSETWPVPEPDDPAALPDPFSPDPGLDLDATIAATAASTGAQPPALGVLGPAQWSAVPLGLLSLGMLGLLIWGPQPRRVTKWGMFWVLGVPLGLGIGWWLARDTPFSTAMDAVPAPAPRARGLQPNGVDRRGGGVMLLVCWGLAIVIGLALAVVIGLAGSADGPNSPQDVWTVVTR